MTGKEFLRQDFFHFNQEKKGNKKTFNDIL